MPRPYPVISCSTCGPEPKEGTRDHRNWRVAYNRHHGYWPGYKNPQSVQRVQEEPERERKNPISYTQFIQSQNPGLFPEDL
jgi:hypothetical protein